MRATELVQRLNTLLDKHGDVFDLRINALGLTVDDDAVVTYKEIERVAYFLTAEKPLSSGLEVTNV